MRRFALPALLLAIAACGDSTTPNSGFEWPVVSAADAGLDTARLGAMARHIAADLPNVNAVVVVRGGRLAWEWYPEGNDPWTTYDTHSVTKSWVATYAGIALQQGWIASLDQTLEGYFADVFEDPGIDPRLGDVTIRHLMTMSAGIEDEQSNRFPAGTTDLVRKLLRTPLTHDPGSAFQYDGAQPHIVSGLIARVTGENLAQIANDDLFQAMNITRGRWLTDPDGVSNGGTGLIMAARDLAKLGELYLRDGVWEGVRYLPPGYAELVAGTVSFDLPNQWDYGMLWWTTDVYGPRMWIAAGFRGQYVVVVPSLDLVTVIQSESHELRGDVEDHFHLVVQFVVPAAR